MLFVEEKIDSSFYYSFKALEVAQRYNKISRSDAKQNLSLLFIDQKSIRKLKHIYLWALKDAPQEEVSKIYLKLADVFCVESKIDSAEFYIEKSLFAREK